MLLREIKNKINLTQNISEITRALELVSAVKMKKAQSLAQNSRPFTQKVLEILKRLSLYRKEFEESFYFREAKKETFLWVVITSDKGFCGSFNRNILNFVEKEIKKEVQDIEIFAIGKKAINFFKKRKNKVLVEFSGIGDYGEFEKVKPIADLLVRYFKEGRFKKIFLFYTDFISTFLQKPIKIQVLPLDLEGLKEILRNYELKEKRKIESVSEEKEEDRELDYILEPSAGEIFENLVPQMIEYLIYHTILEANASEHSARMLAMRSASQNAKDVLEKLRLEYNKARQTQITAEVLEVTMAREALE